MNRPNDQQIRHATEADPIDQILSTEEPILPSSGFLAAVMDRVEEEARVPAPIPFPWKRAIPGFVLAAGVFGYGACELVRYGIPSLRNLTLPQPHFSLAASNPIDQAGWVAIALAISFLAWKLSSRLSGQS